jgi:hypothetical protein
MSTTAANPESNTTSTDDPILHQVSHCPMPTPSPETLLSLLNLRYKLLYEQFITASKHSVLAIHLFLVIFLDHFCSNNL